MRADDGGRRSREKAQTVGERRAMVVSRCSSRRRLHRVVWPAGMRAESVVSKPPDVSTNPASRYVLTTPARNEREGLPALLATMAAQNLLPLVWVIVDDGSDDGSREW